jgi:ribosomal protein L11 methyltransferase
MNDKAKNEAKKIWVAARVVFEADDPATAADLIADIFHGWGLQGVVLETPEQGADVDWDTAAAAPSDTCAVTGYFPRDAREAGRRRELARSLSLLEQRAGIRCRVETATVDEEDWAESWKAHFEPERVGNRTVIRPSWRPYSPQPKDVVIEIDPGMAFGTGTHPTTRLCIQLLERWTTDGARFLDVGTGSGVLMCVAAAFGAGRMLGVDNDPVAVSVAAENLRKNRVPEDRFTVRTGDLLADVDEAFDVVAANILTPVILKLLGGIDRVMAPGAILICSGVLEENAQKVADRMRDRGLEVLEVRSWEDWAAIAARWGGSGSPVSRFAGSPVRRFAG